MTTINTTGASIEEGYLPVLQRPGPPPTTRRTLPHTQLDQQPTDPDIRADLAKRAFALAGVAEVPSGISVPGARALVLTSVTAPTADDPAFLVGTEFAHLHPGPDFSLHMTLPEPAARVVVERGWGEWHPFVEQGLLPATVVMVFAPRDRNELETVWQLVLASHRFAIADPSTRCACTSSAIPTVFAGAERRAR